MKNIRMHFYCCEGCIVMFGVEEAFEDQSSVACPVCHSSDLLEDAGYGLAQIIEPSEYEKSQG